MVMSRAKKYIDIDVLTAAKQRINHLIDTFDTLAVMFSGGKDSLVVLHLLKEVFDERGITKPVNVVFRDEELIPMDVIDFVNKYRQEPWIKMIWFAVPLQSTKYVLGVCYNYIQWDKNRKWVREMPKWAVTTPVNDTKVFDQYSMDSYAAEYYKGKIAFLTGIRSSESIMRFRASVNKLNENYINAVESTDRVKLCKPIYDWEENDVFRYFYDREIAYCKLYDHQMWAGQSLRVSTPLHAESAKRFNKIKASAPEMYANVIEIFPEMLAHERYYSELDREGIKARYGQSYEGVLAWIEENIEEEGQYKKATQRYNSVMKRALKTPNSYPPKHLLNAFMSGAYKREILPISDKTK
jgi:predicted phosphoadenosine phosphosulfate sulfurtransferase